MKYILAALVVSTLALAAPILENRQLTGITANEYTAGGCRDIIFFFARGTTEPGNMGDSTGPPTSDGLKAAFGADRVAAQGVDYPALLITNLDPGGADPNGIATMASLFNSAASSCPNSVIVAGGYSQGAAIVHSAIKGLSASVMSKIIAAVTYGDTRKKQDHDRIPKYPTNETLIICNVGDAVCDGTLLILPEHLDYVRHVPEAVSFLTGKLKAAGK